MYIGAKHMQCIQECTTHRSPAMNRKVGGPRLISQPFPKHWFFASLRVVNWIAMTLPVGLKTGAQVHRTHKSASYNFS